MGHGEFDVSMNFIDFFYESQLVPPTHGNLLQSLSITWIWNTGSAAAVAIDAVIAVALNVNIAVAVESVTSVQKTKHEL